MGVAVSSSHVVSAAPSFSGEGLLTLFPCSSVGSLPRGSAHHELLQRESFARAAVLHKLLQRGLCHEVTAFFGPSHLLRCGVLHGLQGNLCSTVNPPWAAGRQPAISPRAAGEPLLRRLAGSAGMGVMGGRPSVTPCPCHRAPPHHNPAPQTLPSLPCEASASSWIQGMREVSPVPQKRRGQREAVGQCGSCLVKHRRGRRRGGVSQ